MELRNKTIRLMDGKNLVVHEADASYDARMSLLVNEANEAKHDDKTFLFFWRMYYPILASCTSGEVPAPAEAYTLTPEALDTWYLAVWELNQDILGEVKKGRRERVEFRDGASLTVCETLDFPSFTLKIVSLENEAIARADIPAAEVSFRTYIYPRVAGCSVGDVPDVETAVKFPRAELAKWSAVVMNLNPKLFQFIMDEAAKAAPPDAEDVKKKGKRRSHHRSALPALS